MTLTALTASAVLFSGAKLPAGSDPNFESYFSQALTYTTPEPHRAMAMLELLLVPMGSEVYVNLENLPDGIRQRFAGGIQRGFGLWEDALAEDFPFRLRFDRGGRPKFEIRVVDKIDDDYHQMGEMFVTRRVTWSKRSHHGEIDGTMKISRYSRPGRHLTPGEVTHIVAHELGHTFGLDDVESVREIMGPVLIGRPYARLTREEVRRVKHIRDMIRLEYRAALAAER
jgi:hypothetical protein